MNYSCKIVLNKVCKIFMSYLKTLSYQSFLKSPYKSIKHTTYFEVYDDLFTKFRNKKIIFVEIGVLNGGSLFMWRNFFGPGATIIGIDLNPEAKKWEKHGFKIFIGDQSDVNFWKKFKKQVGFVDIILDDGGHKYNDQIISTECMIKNIKSNGMIVIEDTHSSYMDGFGNKKYSFINYIKNKIDKMNYRFHRLNKKKSENNFWSLRIYESIVAICINNNFEITKSMPISNNGIDGNAEDIRVKKNFHEFNYLSKFFIFIYSKFFNFKKKIDIKKYFD